MRELIGRHRYGMQDLDDTGRITRVIADATKGYRALGDDEAVQALILIKYRNGLHKATTIWPMSWPRNRGSNMGEQERRVPKLRFPGFTDPWEKMRLGGCDRD